METVLLKIIGGKIIPEIAIPESSTILDLKRKIKALTNVAIRRQTLKFNNEELMNDKTIADYDIKFSVELELEVIPLPCEAEFKILVRYCGQDAKVKVKRTTLVSELKVKMERLWGIPREYTTLHLGSIEMEDAGDPLSAYYLGNDSQIEVKLTQPR